MIRVEFNPDTLAGEQRSHYEAWMDKARAALEKVAAEEHPNPESRGKVWRDFRTWLGEHFFASKCAYCEGPLGAQSEGVAEHWRPKSAVQEAKTDKPWKPVLDKLTNEPHRGYWWLAFAWENLVPGCHLCNEQKGVKFPIAGERVFAPDVSADVEELDRRERPLLLHPFRGDDPVRHIGFDAKGFAYAKDKSPFGEATIRVCDLNRRKLQRQRALAQRSAVDALAMACQDKFRFGETVDMHGVMEDRDGPCAPYSQAVVEALLAPEQALLEDLLRRRDRRASRLAIEAQPADRQS